MAQQKMFSLLPLVGLFVACSDGGTTAPPPAPPQVAFTDASPATIIAGSGSIELQASASAGASCRVQASPSTLDVHLPSGCGVVRVTAGAGLEGSFTVTLTATLNGRESNALKTVTVERRRIPASTVRDTFVYLNREVAISINANADVDECTASLLGPSTATYGGPPRVGDGVTRHDARCAWFYLAGNMVMHNGVTRRGIEVRSLSRQSGAVPDVDTLWITRLVPKVTVSQVSGEVCLSGAARAIEVTSDSLPFIMYNGKDHFGTLVVLHEPRLGIAPPTERGVTPANHGPNKVSFFVGGSGFPPDQVSPEWILTATNDTAGWEFSGENDSRGRVRVNRDC